MNFAIYWMNVSIHYRINDRIVRGLDYYNKTVFEVTAKIASAQNALGGGGRYDGLIASFGGPDLPGVGFGTGIERILQTMISQNVALPQEMHPLVYFIPLGSEARDSCFRLATECRHRKIPAEIDLAVKKNSKRYCKMRPVFLPKFAPLSDRTS